MSSVRLVDRGTGRRLRVEGVTIAASADGRHAASTSLLHKAALRLSAEPGVTISPMVEIGILSDWYFPTAS